MAESKIVNNSFFYKQKRLTTKCLKRVKNLERYTFLFYFTTFLLVSFAIKKIVRRIRNEGMIVDNLYIFFHLNVKIIY